jgi:ATP-dependent helicase/nuclease subunit B
MPRIERDVDVNAIEMGKIYHEIAYEFIRRTSNMEDFPDLQKTEYEPIIDQIMKDILPTWWNSNYSNSEKGKSIERKIYGVAMRTAENLLYQYRSGQFRPYAEEIEFGKGIIPCIIVELSDGTKLELRGRIDRIDVFRDEEIYARVVDYKSGNKNVDPTKLYWGLQLQLPIYLLAVISHLEGIMPGGFFYCQIADPTIRIESRIKEEVEKKIADQLSLKGLMLSDVSLIKAQGLMTDENKKHGNKKEMLTYDEMKTVLEYARNKATELAEEMISGVIKPSPYVSGNEPICKTCEYKSICGYDAELTKSRILGRKTTSDIINE